VFGTLSHSVLDWWWLFWPFFLGLAVGSCFSPFQDGFPDDFVSFHLPMKVDLVQKKKI